MGMRVAMLDSTTFEEAPTTFNIWLRQRSRWLKGYMQTWLVHMRDPGALRRDIGWRGFFSLQFFLGGSVISALVNPLLWLVFLVSGGFVVPAADDVSTMICLLSLLGGNVILTWLAVIAPRRRGWSEIAPYGFTASFYWALISIAAWRAFWQLVTQPFYWEKTEHGLSRLDQPPR
jgi:cellulose synthase/poly-beta-1,6-N-acetylglucosamine synthase-like glycosyltransferase